MKKIPLVLAGVALVLAGCGGGEGRPSVEEVQQAILAEDNVFNAFTEGAAEEVVTCMAEALHGSDLSDEALQAIVDGDDGYEGSSDDEQAIADITGDLAACATA